MPVHVKGTESRMTPKITMDLTTLVERVRRFSLVDKDLFEDANGTADTDRWSSDYAAGTEGGAAAIASGVLTVTEDPDGSPTAAIYAVTYLNPMYSRYYQTLTDIDVTWGAQSSGDAHTGLMVTKGTAYDSQNYLSISRYKTSGTNVIRVDGKLNNSAIFSGTPTDVSITDDVIAFKIERLGDEWRFYYSTQQDPVEEWVFVDTVEDTSNNYMTNETTVMLYADTSGGNTDNSVSGEFDNWKLYMSDEGVDELVGIVGRDNSDNAFSTSNVAPDIDGTIVERIESLQKVMQIVDAAAGDGFEEDGTGGTLYSMFNSTDTNTNFFTGDGGTSYNDNLFSFLKTLSTYIADGDGDFASGTALGSNASLVDALGTNGLDTLTHDYSHTGIMQYMHGHHAESVVLFVIPEAVGSIVTNNSTMLTELQKLAEVITITQNAALAYPDFEAVSLIVLGTNSGTGWTLGNLADIKTIPNLPILCVDGDAAAYLGLGTDGGPAATKTTITAVTNIDGSVLGAGLHDITGIDSGSNTVAASGITFDTLNMSDGDITETWYASETDGSADNTNVVLGEIRRVQVDGTIGIDVDAGEVAATMGFYGCGYSFDGLNTLGKAVFRLFAQKLIRGATIGQVLTISGDIGDLETKLFGNVKTRFSNTSPLAAFIAGNSGGLGTEMPNSKSLYDILWVDRTSETSETTGFLATAAMTTSETDVATLTDGTAITGTTRRKITYWLDFTNIDGDANNPDCTIRVKKKIDASTYRTVDTITWVNGTSNNGIAIEIAPANQDLQLTIEMSAALAGDKRIPHQIIQENLEY